MQNYYGLVLDYGTSGFWHEVEELINRYEESKDGGQPPPAELWGKSRSQK